MGSNLLTQNPFAVLTFIAAPALLTNASCLLALSTINRLLRTRDSMRELLKESENTTHPARPNFIEHVNRVEQQAMLLLGALRWVYTALGSFAAASLVTLLGAVTGELGSELATRVVTVTGLLLGVLGVTGLVGGCLNLLHATQLSLLNIRGEAEFIRARQEQKKTSGDQKAA
jgi:Protein of unknown function (DUF2721)